MNFKPIVFLLIGLNLACSEDSEKKLVEIKTSFGEIAKGEVLKDSTFHGTVKYYDIKSNSYLGYSTFKYGYEQGPSVRIKNEITVDSLYYQEPIKNGYEFLFDDKRHLSYKAYLFDGRVFGPAFEYDSLGNIQHFVFYNFEGDILYQAKYTDSGKYEKGSMINVKVHDRMVNDESRNILFLYLIPEPKVHGYYEIAVFDDKKQKISSKRIKSDKFYYDAVLESILPNQHYAIIYHYDNLQDNKNKVIIQEIFL